MLAGRISQLFPRIGSRMVPQTTWHSGDAYVAAAAARKLGSEERAMDLLIDTRGRRQQRSAVHLSCAIWRKGLIHIRKKKGGIVVSLSPAIVKGSTIAGAVYAIADINPKSISLIMEQSDRVAVVFDSNWKAACRRMCELVIAGRRTEEAKSDAFRYGATPLMEPEVPDDPECIIGATLNQYVGGNSESLTRAILEHLWEAGYDVRPNRC